MSERGMGEGSTELELVFVRAPKHLPVMTLTTLTLTFYFVDLGRRGGDRIRDGGCSCS